MHLGYHHPASLHQHYVVDESRMMTHNVRSYADAFGFFVTMKAWRNVLLTVSQSRVVELSNGRAGYRSRLCSFFFRGSIGIELKCWDARFL